MNIANMITHTPILWPRREQPAPTKCPKLRCSLCDHLTWAPFWGLNPSLSMCDHPFSWPVGIISGSDADGWAPVNPWALSSAWLVCIYLEWWSGEWESPQLCLLGFFSLLFPSSLFVKAEWRKRVKHRGECYHFPKTQDQNQCHSL